MFYFLMKTAISYLLFSLRICFLASILLSNFLSKLFILRSTTDSVKGVTEATEATGEKPSWQIIFNFQKIICLFCPYLNIEE